MPFWHLLRLPFVRYAKTAYVTIYGDDRLNEKPLPADEIIPTKLAMKTKLNSYGGLDKLKTRICLRGDMQIKDANNNSWSPTASSRLLKCLIADAAQNKSTVYQLDFIQAFI